MQIIIVIDDLNNGQVAVNAQYLMSNAELAAGTQETPASVMGDFLQKACDAYLGTRHMNLEQAQRYLQSRVTQPVKPH